LPVALPREVVDPQHDVLGGPDDGLPVRRGEDVVGRHHEDPRLHLRLDGERNVDRHLVPVEVGVEGEADQRMQLDRLPLDQHRLEGLHPETVERRRPVQHDGKLADDLVEGVPDLPLLLLHHLLRLLDGGREPGLLELVEDERLEQLERHLLGEAALVKFQLRPDDDHRAARVVDALPEEVLAEPAALPLQHVRQRLEGALVRSRDELSPAAVVEQRVHGLLQHPLLVPDDDLGRGQVEKALQPVVPVDDATVKVVQVGGGESPAIQRDQGAKVRRQDGDHLLDHPLGFLLAVPERLDDLQPLGDLLLLRLGRGVEHILAERLGELRQVQPGQQRPDRLRAHPHAEPLAEQFLLLLVPLEELAVLLELLPVLRLGEDLLRLRVGFPRIKDDVLLEVDDRLDVLHRHVEDRRDPGRKAFQEPDVRDRRGQLDVAHPLAADLRLDDLDAALLADDPPVLHPLVLAAVALVVLDGTEDFRAEQAVALGLEGPVVQRLRLLHLPVRPLADLLRGCDRDPDPGKMDGILRFFNAGEKVFHGCLPVTFPLRLPAGYCWGSSLISSTSRPSAWSSLISTLNDSGSPGSREKFPLTMDSYILARPGTSSDLTVRNS
jgi:hypothetical protein